jgi:hypothetical protein
MHTNELHCTKFRLIKNCSLYDLPTRINSGYDFLQKVRYCINDLFQKLLVDLKK